MKRSYLLLVVTLLCGFQASVLYAGAAPKTAGAILARPNKLSIEQRQTTLVEKAKAEGVEFMSPIMEQTAKEFGQILLGR